MAIALGNFVCTVMDSCVCSACKARTHGFGLLGVWSGRPRVPVQEKEQLEMDLYFDRQPDKTKTSCVVDPSEI